jgi:hypothetical protein
MNTKTVRLLEQHSELILSALEFYRRELETSRQEMTKAAAECQAGYDRVKDDPEARAGLDQRAATPGMISIAPTTAGLHRMAQLFTESAQDYAVKIAALDKLAGALDPYGNDEEY